MCYDVNFLLKNNVSLLRKGNLSINMNVKLFYIQGIFNVDGESSRQVFIYLYIYICILCMIDYVRLGCVKLAVLVLIPREIFIVIV